MQEMQETQALFLGQEEPLEQKMPTTTKKEKSVAEDEIISQHYQLIGQEFEQTQIVKEKEVWCVGVTKSQT